MFVAYGVASLEVVASLVMSGVTTFVSVTVACVGSTMMDVVPLMSTVYVPGLNVLGVVCVNVGEAIDADVVVVVDKWQRSHAGLVMHWKYLPPFCQSPTHSLGAPLSNDTTYSSPFLSSILEQSQAPSGEQALGTETVVVGGGGAGAGTTVELAAGTVVLLGKVGPEQMRSCKQ